MFHSHSLLKSNFPTLLPSPLKLQNCTTPKCTKMNVWRFGISFTYVIESIDSKFISVCLINDYSLIALTYMHLYMDAQCTKVKLLILNIFFILILMLLLLVFNDDKYNFKESNWEKLKISQLFKQVPQGYK